jgi:S1-C subfamily serine protease
MTAAGNCAPVRATAGKPEQELQLEHPERKSVNRRGGTGNRNTGAALAVAVALLVLPLIIAAVAGCGSGNGAAGTGTVTVAATAPAPLPMPDSNFTGAIAKVAAQVKPAVVQITNEQQTSGQFNQPFTVPTGVGSGIIYDNQGHILTNDHVVSGAQKLLVTLPDGRTFDARLVGGDTMSDIAVVQISGSNLPVAALGDASKLNVGDWVVAIGNALALPGGPTVTTGVVSALGRTVQEPGSTSTSQGPYLFNVIQTDAPINPGNSGGPLVNLAGQVVGLNTLVAGNTSQGAQAQGIGFAISINTAQQIAGQLVSTGKVIHPYIGITYQPLDAAAASQLGIQSNQGVLVVSVAPGSPAAADGALKAGDVITEVDGKALVSDSDLAQIINTHKPGDTLTLTVLRANHKISVKVTLGTIPPSAAG